MSWECNREKGRGFQHQGSRDQPCSLWLQVAQEAPEYDGKLRSLESPGF